MSTQLYTVTLTDLGEYTVSVAADSATEAQRIAKSVLYEEATTLPDGLAIVKRDCDAKAVLAEVQPARIFEVSATYMLDFSLKVPASTRSEAELHAKRLYEDTGGPHEFEHDGDRISSFHAREVVS